jgi:hypothetical protein
MATVIGPNGHATYVPDDVAAGLVGNGTRGYVYAPPATRPEPKAVTEPATKPAPRKRTPRKPSTK